VVPNVAKNRKDASLCHWPRCARARPAVQTSSALLILIISAFLILIILSSPSGNSIMIPPRRTRDNSASKSPYDRLNTITKIWNQNLKPLKGWQFYKSGAT